VTFEGATEAPQAAIQRLKSQILRQYARLADEDYHGAFSSQEQLFRDLQQLLLDRQPYDWTDEEEGEEEDFDD